MEAVVTATDVSSPRAVRWGSALDALPTFTGAQPCTGFFCRVGSKKVRHLPQSVLHLPQLVSQST